MDRILIHRRANEIRELLNVDDNSPIDLINLIKFNKNLTLIFYPFKEKISGICIKKANLIAINSTSTKGRQAFSLAHELYHYFYDENSSTISYLSDNSDDKIEEAANLFASYLLMPDCAFSRLYNKITSNGKEKIELKHILEMEQYFNVSRNALLVRLVQEGYLSVKDCEQYKTDIIKNALRYGYDISLYLPLDDKKQVTYGAYLKMALLLKEKGIISEGRYEQYLLEAFRDDIVFNENIKEDIYD